MGLVSLGLEMMGGDAARATFALRPEAVRDGELWRLATAHLVHLGQAHLVLNFVGMALIAVTLWPVLTLPRLVRVALVSGAVISGGMMVLLPDGQSYVGFSAIAHGVFAYGGLMLLRQRDGFGVVVTGCLAGKLLLEAVSGALPTTAMMIGGEVSYLSHVLGAVGGWIATPLDAAPGMVRRLRVGALGLGAVLVVVQAGLWT